MTWSEARAVAGEVMGGLRKRFGPEEIRLTLRALSRLHHKGKETKMQTPVIIVTSIGGGRYEINVLGRFGGGYTGYQTDRAGVLAGKAPASVIVPPELEGEFRKVFPGSFEAPVKMHSTRPDGNGIVAELMRACVQAREVLRQPAGTSPTKEAEALRALEWVIERAEGEG